MTKVKWKLPPLLHELEIPETGAHPLPNPWVDGHSVKPTHFEPLGLRNGFATFLADKQRGGVYQPDQWVHPPDPPGTYYNAIGCAWIETKRHMVDVSLVWNGHAVIPDVSQTPNSHIEATPLLYVDVDNPLGGFGAWPSLLFGNRCFLVGYMGSPVELFRVVGLGTMTGHTEGEPYEVRLVTVEPGKVILYGGGVQQPITTDSNYHGPPRDPMDPVEVHPSLVHSTCHGYELDGHIVWPQEDVLTTPGLFSLNMTAWS